MSPDIPTPDSGLDLHVVRHIRATDPGAIGRAWAGRRPGTVPSDGRLLLIAADHPARGAFGVRSDPYAMATRPDLLARIATALSRPGVDGILGTADILEDLLLTGHLDGKLVLGSMNRGGLQGAGFELDDRFTGYDAATIAANGLDGGKMLARICLQDHGTIATLEGCAQAVSALAARSRWALIEPFLTTRVGPDRVRNLLDADSVIASMQIAAGLGATSAYTWLKLPVVEDMPRVLASTTLPTLLLGGDLSGQPEATYAAWGDALAAPAARGLIVGRALLYPIDDDVAAAVDRAADLVHGGTS
ncbi:MAG: deoxyribose-phosphate aldolase [Nostocoides sp.]